MVRCLLLAILIGIPAGLYAAGPLAYLKVRPDDQKPDTYLPGASDGKIGYEGWIEVLSYEYETARDGSPAIPQEIVIKKPMDRSSREFASANTSGAIIDDAWLHVLAPEPPNNAIVKFAFKALIVVSVEWGGIDDDGRPFEVVTIRPAIFRGAFAPLPRANPPTVWHLWGWNFTSNNTSNLPPVDPPDFIPPDSSTIDSFSIGSPADSTDDQASALVATREDESQSAN
jgi:hypothetical protein